MYFSCLTRNLVNFKMPNVFGPLFSIKFSIHLFIKINNTELKTVIEHNQRKRTKDY